jgi:hypothetical protein
MFLGFWGGSRSRETETSSAHFADEALGVTPGIKEVVPEDEVPESAPDLSPKSELLPASELVIAPELTPTVVPEAETPTLSIAPVESAIPAPVMPEVPSAKPEIPVPAVTAPETVSIRENTTAPARDFVHKVLHDYAA